MQREIVIIGDLIMTEVSQGFRKDEDFRKAKEFFGFLTFKELGDLNIALQSAVNYRILRKKGIVIRKTIDVIIGAYCIENRLILLHDDRDFDPLEKHLKLKVASPDTFS